MDLLSKVLDKNFYVRTASALVMLGVFITATVKGGFWFSLLVLVVSSTAMFEWCTIVAQRDMGPSIKMAWDILGLSIVLISCASMLYLGMENDRRPLILLCGAVWFTDIGAYIAGKSLGGPKIAPSISPKKTISGSIGGLFSSFIFGVIFHFTIYDASSPWKVPMLAVLVSLLAQISDLLESAFKRKFGVKDSGFIIPGHGGVLDRIDSFLLPLPLMIMVSI